MTPLIPIHVLILHPIHRTHVTNLCGKIFAELVSEQKNTRGEMRNLNGLRVEPRLHLRAGKRIVDVAELNPDVGIRQESGILRRLVLRRGGAGMSQEHQGRDRPKTLFRFIELLPYVAVHQPASLLMSHTLPSAAKLQLPEGTGSMTDTHRELKPRDRFGDAIAGGAYQQAGALDSMEEEYFAEPRARDYSAFLPVVIPAESGSCPRQWKAVGDHRRHSRQGGIGRGCDALAWGIARCLLFHRHVPRGLVFFLRAETVLLPPHRGSSNLCEADPEDRQGGRGRRDPSATDPPHRPP